MQLGGALNYAPQGYFGHCTAEMAQRAPNIFGRFLSAKPGSLATYCTLAPAIRRSQRRCACHRSFASRANLCVDTLVVPTNMHSPWPSLFSAARYATTAVLKALSRSARRAHFKPDTATPFATTFRSLCACSGPSGLACRHHAKATGTVAAQVCCTRHVAVDGFEQVRAWILRKTGRPTECRVHLKCTPCPLRAHGCERRSTQG